MLPTVADAVAVADRLRAVDETVFGALQLLAVHDDIGAARLCGGRTERYWSAVALLDWIERRGFRRRAGAAPVVRGLF